MLPTLISKGGPLIWPLLAAGAAALVIIVERTLHYHRAQINATEFLVGIKNVLKQKNVVEAVSICDATPGPAPRLVKCAILNRHADRDQLRDALESAGLVETSRLEEKLSFLATIAQVSPLIGLLGSALGFVNIFYVIQESGPYANPGHLFGGVWQSLISSAFGLAVAIPSYIGYNFLVTRVNSILLDMEKVANEIIAVALQLGASETDAKGSEEEVSSLNHPLDQGS
jgi:biopolymer transport protein ExbB